MFTGIIEEMGQVHSVERLQNAARFTITAPKTSKGMKVGDSVSINGACLTAISVTPPNFVVEAMEETMARTNLGWLQSGDRVNLERPLPVNGRFDGHIVNGHVDGTAVVSQIRQLPHSKLMKFHCPQELTQFMVEKGCVAVDGVSLTIVECGKDWFSVALIPYTLQVTTLGLKKIGDAVNIEVDIIAKYMRKFLNDQIQMTKSQ